MAQKYKVFNNTKVFEIAPADAAEEPAGNITTIGEINEKIINRFKNAGDPGSYTLCLSKNVEGAWKQFRSFFTWIEAAGGLVVNGQNELLVIYRLGKWDLPKGKIDAGETPLEAAKREIGEECGIRKLTNPEPLPNTYHVYFQKGEWYLKCTHWFYFRYSENEQPHPQKDEGIELVRWMNPAAVARSVPGTYASLSPLFSRYLHENEHA